MLKQLWSSLAATLVLGVICCGIYPLVIWGIAQAVFPNQANGSLIKKDGTPAADDTQAVGSALIGQSFSAPKYFRPRPSQNNYDAANSGGSNYGPLSKTLIDTVRQRVAQYRAENGISDPSLLIPGDAVTASGSGLDPHISPPNAEFQARRVADARKIPVEKVRELIVICTDAPDLGIFGEARVNVLKLNLALDNMK